MMVEKMEDLEPIIKHVLEQYNDLFEWVFDNLPNLDLDQKYIAHRVKVEFDDQNDDNFDLCHSNKFITESQMSYNESDNEPIKQKHDNKCPEVLSEINEIANQMDEIRSESNRTQQKIDNKQVIQKRPRGRPRKFNVRPKKKNLGQLWEFLLKLLASRQTNPSLIRWVCRKEGLFKLIQNEKVAKIWGDRRHNPKMNYKKMSRTMR